MRILLMPSSYAPILGGLQTVALMLSRHLLLRGHKVQVVANRYPRSLPTHEMMDEIPVRRFLFLTPSPAYLRHRRPDLFLAGLYFFPFSFFKLSRLMEAFQPDVVNVHFPDAQVPFVLRLRRRFDFRLIVSLHGHDLSRWLGRDTGRTGNEKHEKGSLRKGPEFSRFISVLQESDGITACSRYLLNKAIQLEPTVSEKGFVIHNGIDPVRFQDRTSYPHPRPYILAYGRLTHKKGFDLLLEAFAQVREENPGMDLILAGDGEELEALQARARRLGLDKKVYFFGRAAPEEVVRLLNGCEFVVVPSRREPFGIVALEAMAAGKPVLATRVGGLTEFVDSSVNMIVEPTVGELAEGLDKWLKRADKFQIIGDRNRKQAKSHDWSDVTERYLEIYR